MRYELIDAARTAAAGAYAPYSGYKVGAACRDSAGRVFTGANVENSSYSVTICGERMAIGNAVISGKMPVCELAVWVDGDQLPRICGACLQMIAEFADDLVVLLGAGEQMEQVMFSELLPRPFRLGDQS